MVNTYNITVYDVGSEIELSDYHAKLFGEFKKFKWTEPLVREIAKGSYEFVFNFGAVAFVNVEEADIKTALFDVKKFVKNFSSAPNKEEYWIEIDPSISKEEVSFDKVSLPKMDIDTVKILAFVLAQSVTLGTLERMADSMLDELEDILDEFQKTGKVKGEKQLIRSVAYATKMRYFAISNLALLDKPPVTWESKRLNSFYENCMEMFELKERLNIVEHKLNTVLDNCGVILDIANTKKSLFVEWMIVLLFVIDIILILIDVLK